MPLLRTLFPSPKVVPFFLGFVLIEGVFLSANLFKVRRLMGWGGGRKWGWMRRQQGGEDCQGR